MKKQALSGELVDEEIDELVGRIVVLLLVAEMESYLDLLEAEGRVEDAEDVQLIECWGRRRPWDELIEKTRKTLTKSLGCGW